MKIRHLLSSLGLGLGLLSTQVSAALISGVSIEDVSSHWGGRVANHVVDGSGFNAGTGTHDATAPDATMWLNHDAHGTINSSNPVIITFDLGANYSLGSVDVWNYNEYYGTPTVYLERGARDVDILVSDTVGGSFTLLNSFVFDMATGSTTTDFSQNIDLSGYAAAADTRLIRFSINSNYSSTEPYFVGLSEVQFNEGDADAAVPAPGTLALLLGGLIAVRRNVLGK